MVKALVPDAYRLVAVEMHMHRALPNFFEELDRVKNKVETYAIDAKLQMLGRPSKLVVGGNAGSAPSFMAARAAILDASRIGVSNRTSGIFRQKVLK